MKISILNIDADREFTQSLADYFAGVGIEIISIASADRALALLSQLEPTLIILDANLPDRSGVELCREIRKQRSLPLIFLSTRAAAADKIMGLNAGADDYLAKPCDLAELHARILAVLRRGKETAETRVERFSGLELDRERRTVKVDSRPIDLSALEFEALKVFVDHHERVLSREELSEKLRGTAVDSTSRSMDVLVSRLRQKLSDRSTSPRFFRTIRGVGYSFVALRE